jgi:2-octaprenyl-6-methoxyphenol hydroxylase
MEKEHFEVAVVGGGMVGISLALGLAGAGIPVALIERAQLTSMAEATFDGRGSAVAAGSQRILEGLCLWEGLSKEAEPILEIRVADGISPLFLHYDHKEIDDGPLGWIVENAVIRRVLSDAALKSSLKVYDGALLAQCDFEEEAAVLQLGNGKCISARLVVAADGRDSPLREAARIDTVRWSYAQTGIVCALQHEVPHNGVAHEHFLPAGPFAILPMTNNRSSIVWTEHNDLAPDILALNDDEFATEVRRRVGGFLGKINLGPTRWSYPLSVVHSKSYISPRLALAGDAAHAIHPIAGQGFNIGLRDVAALAEVIVDSLRLGLDPGSMETLERYELWRKPDNMMMIGVTELLNRLFSNSVPPVRLARDIGLAAVDRAGPLKNFFMRHAMGLVGDLPRLTRGEPL